MQDDPDLLLRFLRDEISASDLAVVDSAPAPYAAADKYLLASLLQKSIRRGNTIVACRAARQLLQIDARRFWRRLMVVALEDVGIANVKTAVSMIAAASKAQWRRELGGDTYVGERIVALACRSLKDRSGDYCISLLKHEASLVEERASLQDMAFSALLAIIRTRSASPYQRIQAAVVAGARSTCERLSNGGNANLEALFRTFEEMAIPAHVAQACRIYASRSYDELAVIIPCLWDLWQTSQVQPKEIIHTIPKAELDRVPLYALDPLHTRLGRQALSLWVKSYIVPPPWNKQQLAIALWNWESALCNRRLDWPFGEELRTRGHRADFLARGIPPEEHEAITAFVRDEHKTLNFTRWCLLRQVQRAPAA